MFKGRDDLFLGTGWGFPPTFARANASVVMISGEADVKEAMWIILSTKPGERVMLPQFGCGIWDKVFTTLTTTTATDMANLVSDALLEWEPRITVEAVNVDSVETERGLVEISIDYTIRTTNSRSNLVYPFYILEANIPQQMP